MAVIVVARSLTLVVRPRGYTSAGQVSLLVFGPARVADGGGGHRDDKRRNDDDDDEPALESTSTRAVRRGPGPGLPDHPAHDGGRLGAPGRVQHRPLHGADRECPGTAGTDRSDQRARQQSGRRRPRRRIPDRGAPARHREAARPDPDRRGARRHRPPAADRPGQPGRAAGPGQDGLIRTRQDHEPAAGQVRCGDRGGRLRRRRSLPDHRHRARGTATDRADPARRAAPGPLAAGSARAPSSATQRRPQRHPSRGLRHHPAHAGGQAADREDGRPRLRLPGHRAHHPERGPRRAGALARPRPATHAHLPRDRGRHLVPAQPAGDRLGSRTPWSPGSSRPICRPGFGR